MERRRQRRFGRFKDRATLGTKILTFLIYVAIAGGCGSSSATEETKPGSAAPTPQASRRIYTEPRAWRVVLPKPYKYIDVAGTKFGINTIFVRSREEAEKYRQQGAYVEPLYQDTYGGMRIP